MGPFHLSLQPLRTFTRFVDRRVATTFIGRLFRLEGCGHPQERKDAHFFREILAGLTTFFMMSYIIALSASLISETGGTCVCPRTSADPICRVDEDYALCQLGIKRDIITGTIVISGLSTLAFGILVNLPIALGPGVGLLSYFAHVVGYHGTGPVTYELALTAVFAEGFIFVFLSLLGLRQWLVKIIPLSIKVASGVGIGLFLTEIGLSTSTGLGVITSGGIETPLALGGCQSQYINNTTGMCDGNIMHNPQSWIGITVGFFFVAFLMAYKIQWAIMLGITLVSAISWPRDTSFTFFPRTAVGDASFEFFRQVIAFHPIQSTLAVNDFKLDSSSGHQFFLALITFLYVDIIDCSATLFSMARFVGAVDEETGDFDRSTIAYCVDAVSISIGSLFGLGPVTAFVESGSGIAIGGKTGLTSVSTGLCFLMALFFAPILASIPPWATGGPLILVGMLMARQVRVINWLYIGDALPAFVTIAFIPLSYSVAYGLIAGFLTYSIVNLLILLVKIVSKGRVVPPDADLAEYWTYRSGGTFSSFMRLLRVKTHAKSSAKEHPNGTRTQDVAAPVELTNNNAMVGGEAALDRSPTRSTFFTDSQKPSTTSRSASHRETRGNDRERIQGVSSMFDVESAFPRKS